MGLSSVEVAARSGCVEIMEHLVAGDAPLSPSGVYAPLLGAVRSDNPQMVAYLLEAGVDSNQVATGHPESDDSTALGTAAYLGQVEMIDLLVAADAQVDAPNNTGDAPLGLAVTSEEWAAATRLLATGAEPTPDMLVAAVANRSLEGVKLLVSAGVDPSAPASDGQTAIDAARSNRYADTLSYLAETGEAP